MSDTIKYLVEPSQRASFWGTLNVLMVQLSKFITILHNSEVSWQCAIFHFNRKYQLSVWNFDFDNDTRENIFSHPFNSYLTNERLQEEGQFYCNNYLLEMTRSHAKMRLKSAQQNLNFVMAKIISKRFTLGCSYKFPCRFPYCCYAL